MARKRGGIKEMEIVGKYGKYIIELWGNEGLSQRKIGKKVHKKKSDFRISKELNALQNANLIRRSKDPPKGKKKRSANYIYLTDRGKEVYQFFMGGEIKLDDIPDERIELVNEILIDLKDDSIPLKTKKIAFNQLFHQFSDLTFYTDWDSFPEFEEFIIDSLANIKKIEWGLFHEFIHIIDNMYKRGYNNNKVIEMISNIYDNIDINDKNYKICIDYIMQLILFDMLKYPNDSKYSQEFYIKIVDDHKDGLVPSSRFRDYHKYYPNISKIVKGSLRKKIYDLSKNSDEKYSDYFQSILFYLILEANK